MEGYLISWILFDLWIVGLFLYCKTHSLRFLNAKKAGLITFAVLFLIIVFGEFSGDFRHYQEIIDMFSASYEVASNFEPFYVWLMEVTGYDVTLFRTILALIILISVYWSLKLYKELNIPSIFLFTLIPFYFLSNAIRQGVSNSVCLLGLFLLFRNKKKLLSLILIVSSFFLHKSSILVIPALFFLLIPINRRTIILFSVLLIPFIYIENVLLEYFTDILLGDGVIAFYMNATEEGNSTFLMKVMDFVFILIILMLVYFSLKKIYKNSYKISNRSVELLSRLLFGSCYIYLIYSGLQISADYVAQRFAPFMYLPLVIVMMKGYGIRVIKNQIIISLLFIYFIFINLQIYRWYLVFF